tara:strand:- start:221 stop:403 length:183 start_codon:yes stop_codon:yes gene_type:complete
MKIISRCVFDPMSSMAMVELQVRAVDDFGEAALGYAACFGHKMTMSHLMHQYYGLKKQQS